MTYVFKLAFDSSYADWAAKKIPTSSSYQILHYSALAVQKIAWVVTFLAVDAVKNAASIFKYILVRTLSPLKNQVERWIAPPLHVQLARCAQRLHEGVKRLEAAQPRLDAFARRKAQLQERLATILEGNESTNSTSSESTEKSTPPN